MNNKFEVRGLINGGTDWYVIGRYDTGAQARLMADEEADYYPAGLEVWHGDKCVMYYTAVQ